MSRGVEIIASGAMWPAPRPRPGEAHEALGGPRWSAYRLADRPGEDLFPEGRLRRLGRAQAMTLGAVKLCLDSLGDAAAPPSGPRVSLLVGTAWAEFGVELSFLENMIRRGEKGARPAKFASSVHNALAGQVAMAFDWGGENHTFTHDSLSFESALWQGAQLLEQGRADQAVVCGADALDGFLELRGHLLGRLRTAPAALSPMQEEANMAGTVPGEGAAAFMLATAGRSGRRPLARLLTVRTRGGGGAGRPLDAGEAAAFVQETLARSEGPEPDLLLLGANGDGPLDALYREVLGRLGDMPAAVYRHRTGDFATASALGLELAVRALSGKDQVGELCFVGKRPEGGGRSVAMLHLSRTGHMSVVGLER